ncbi:MAG: PAS domain S-box protein [Deltaproteobacteria bacterium]|nr:PAS domain S-box protein [Deltaproteobacteria bacterium]
MANRRLQGELLPMWAAVLALACGPYLLVQAGADGMAAMTAAFGVLVVFVFSWIRPPLSFRRASAVKKRSFRDGGGVEPRDSTAPDAEAAAESPAEDALRESEARYRSVMEAAPDPIVVYDMAGRVTYFNPAFSRVFGWTLEECLGRTLDRFVPEDCWPETRRMIRTTLAGETLSGVETRRRTRWGDIIHVSVSGATYRGRDGQLAGSVIIHRDITAQVKAQKALRLSEEMFSKAFRSSPNGISISTLKDIRLLNVNEAFLGLTGFDREEVIGRAPLEFGLFRDPEEAKRLMEGLRREGQLRGYEVELRRKNDEVRVVRVSAEIIEIWDEPCMLATMEDVTESRRLEREIIEAGDRERRKIGEELHDDLSPHLIGIEVLSKVLSRKLSENGRPQAGDAEKIKQLVTEGIQKTRALTKGLCPVHLTDNGLEFALAELAHGTEAIFGIPCTFETDEPVLIQDNTLATQLFYIAREAVQNAVKHSGAGAIRLGLSHRDRKLTLTVEDDGQGLRQSSGGDGMGLRLMGFRARTIGATLEVKGRPGRGTTVSLSIGIGYENPAG